MADDEEAFHFKNLKGDSSSDWKTCACAKEMSSTKQILEPVSSTSRRGARATYHDEYPRDFGPRIAYTVS